ncbi:protein N-lysine methyltransferase METTL21D-like isoform X2 [Macrosteles quadrilineatus]|nr:protein N-lysine methyltransferase METTL21D-like isoform X2 [Macrosteles quadrilineatus]XP_054268521.1 protein N-lysine methyltransferase METTL21D-like isoform X2 [Macrosteles quadrilineatus]XP_054268522.1 protein N-lysine methyltransferase METTL21D-like isoform X2 [Macrosteles quadrilineatus]
MTDLPEVLDNLTNNIEHNRKLWQPCGGNAEAKPLRWGSIDGQNFPPPDLLIAADCVYYNESVEPLVETMVALSSENTEIILCQEERDTEKQQQAWKMFLQLFNKHFDCEKVPTKDQHSLYSSDEIVIFRAKKKL